MLALLLIIAGHRIDNIMLSTYQVFKLERVLFKWRLETIAYCIRLKEYIVHLSIGDAAAFKVLSISCAGSRFSCWPVGRSALQDFDRFFIRWSYQHHQIFSLNGFVL